MSSKVEVGFELTVGDTPYFRLNDPVKGKLDNVSYRLAGPIWIDISDKVSSVSVKRGKNRELDRYSSAAASISLHNEDRTFDPLNTASPYVGNIIPRRSVRVSTAGVTQFTGVIEDWNLDYDVSGKSNAVIQAADAFTLLAQQSLTAGTATSQLTGARINAVLSQPSVAWPLANRQIDAGNSLLGADVFSGNVLSYLQQVEASEQGQLFMSKGGDVRFVNGSTSRSSGTWTLTGTNLVTNPSMETGSGTVTTRTNFVTNPSFEVNTTGWVTSGTGSTITRVTSGLGIVAGTAALEVVSGTANQSGAAVTGLALTATTQYVYSAYITLISGDPSNLALRVSDGAGTRATKSIAASLIVGTPVRVDISWTSSASPTTGVNIWRSAIAPAAATFRVDAVMVQTGSVVSTYFDGATAAAGDFTYAWTGTANASTSIQRGTGVTTQTGSAAGAIQSTEWAGQGVDSLRIIPTGTNASYSSSTWTGLTVGQLYTVLGTVRLSAALTGTLNANALKITTDSPTVTLTSTASNVAGTYVVRGTFTATATSHTINLWNGASVGNGDVWWDQFLLIAGTYTSTFFDGATIPADGLTRYAWTGTANASTSTKEELIPEFVLTFADDGTGIPYTNASVSYGTELLYNQVAVTYPGGTVTAGNTESQTQYGISATEVDTLLSNSTQAQTLADFWVSKYGQPEYRFQELTVNLPSLTGTQQSQILNSELGDIISVKFTPNNVGSPIELNGQIVAVAHSIGIDRHDIAFGFAAVPFAFFVLDDEGYGILDNGALGF